MIEPLAFEEVQEQVDGLFRCQDMQFAGILDVHDLIADIVGRFHQVDKRVADEFVGVFRVPANAQLGGDAQISIFLRLEETELAFLPGIDGRIGIFDDGSKRAVGKGETALAASDELVGEQAHGIGVAFEVEEVVVTPALFKYLFL